MKEWEKALYKFLEQYKDKDYFLGAILTGSYVTENNNENSDIDVFIVTKDTENWRQRGTELVDGYLIEYFINPLKKVLEYFEEEKASCEVATTMIFINSKIIYDTEKEVEKLISIAKNNSINLSETVNEDDFKMYCYGVWDGFDELTSKYSSKEDIEFSYNIFLQRVIEAYFYNKRLPSISLNKIERVLNNESYRNKYKPIKLPDDTFIQLLNNCFNNKEYIKKYESAKELYSYFMKQFPQFDINKFELKTNI